MFFWRPFGSLDRVGRCNDLGSMGTTYADPKRRRGSEREVRKKWGSSRSGLRTRVFLRPISTFEWCRGLSSLAPCGQSDALRGGVNWRSPLQALLAGGACECRDPDSLFGDRMGAWDAWVGRGCGRRPKRWQNKRFSCPGGARGGVEESRFAPMKYPWCCRGVGGVVGWLRGPWVSEAGTRTKKSSAGEKTAI